MSPSIIFYISPQPALPPSDQPVNRLQHNIRQNFRFESLPRWNLEHKIFRETGSGTRSGTASQSGTNSAPSSQNSNPGSQGSLTSLATLQSSGIKYLQCLTLSWFPRKTWIGVSGGTTTGSANANEFSSQGSLSSVPAGGAVTSMSGSNETSSQVTETAQINGLSSFKSETAKGAEIALNSIPTTSLEQFSSLLSLRLSPLWTPHGGTLSLREGRAVKIQDFTVRYGDLASMAAAGPTTRGSVCEIMYTGSEVPDVAIAGVIHGVWSVVGHGINGWKSFDSSSSGHLMDHQEEIEVRRWMNVLRVRDGR